MEGRDNKNRIKCWSSLYYTRMGLGSFVKAKLEGLQSDILSQINEELCTLCSTPNVLPCPTSGICAIEQGQCFYHAVPINSIYFSCISIMSYCIASIQNIPNWMLPKSCDYHMAFCEKLVEQHVSEDPRAVSKSNASKWWTEITEVAKCFSDECHRFLGSVDDIDLVEICNIIINCKWFQKFIQADLSQPFSIVSKVCLYTDF